MNEQWILVVEDDEEMRDQLLIPGLKRSGFEYVHGVGSAIETYRSMLTKTFAMFILDAGLPDESGIAMARHIRSASDAGIVMLTELCTSNADQVRGLDEGADAYLTKPIDLKLLVATMRSIFRRRQPGVVAATSHPNWVLAYDGWTLFTPSGAEVALTNGEREILRPLFANRGQAVSREQIVAALLETNESDQSVQTFDPHRLELMVHRLRKKIAQHASESFPLNTIRGKGYVFV